MTDNSERNEALHKEDNPQKENTSRVEELSPEKKERYLQQIEGSKKEVERKESILVETYYDLASQDASHLDTLYEKDPKLADKVAQKFHYDSYKDLQNSLTEPKQSNNGLSEDELEAWYQKRKQKDEHEKAMKKANKLLEKIPEEEREKAKKYFDLISDGKTLDSDTAAEFAEMATLYVSRDKLKSDKLNDGLAMLSSTGMNSGKKVAKNDDEPKYIVQNGKLVLLSND